MKTGWSVSWFQAGAGFRGSFRFFFSGRQVRPLFPFLQDLAQLIPLLMMLDLLLQLFHPAEELLLLRVRWVLGPSRRQILQGRHHARQSPMFPLVILLARDAQGLGCIRGRHLTGPDHHNQLGSLLGLGIHLLRYCRKRGWVGKLVYLFEPTGQLGRRNRALAFLEQDLQARAQGFALGQVDPILQGLEHSLHCPLLPLIEGHPVDVKLPADIRRLAAFRPHRQHRLDFGLGAVLGSGESFLPFRFFVRRRFG